METMTQYLPTEGSTTYDLVDSRLAVRPAAVILTIAQVLEEVDEMPLLGSPGQTDAFDELETQAIEENRLFHTTIVERLAAIRPELVEADDLL